MKRKNILLSVACTFLMSVAGQAQASSLQRKLGAKLEVSTSMREGQSMCLLAEGVSGGFTLRAKFSNVGKYPVILSRNSGLVTNPFISHTEIDAYAERYEYKLNLLRHDYGTPGFVEKQGESPSATFVTLKPGETYEHDIHGHLHFALKEYEHYAESDHFIRFGMLTVHGLLYYEAQDGSERTETEMLRARWIRHGYLWFSAVSLPMRIQYTQLRYLKQC
jgi:hypothetical protein